MRTKLRVVRKFEKHEGFTLVLTLLLSLMFVAFLLAAFTRLNVETKVQSNVRLQVLAKENALFALERALLSLQTYAGPDQRVTADAQRNWGSQSLKHSRWVGVWDTTSSSKLEVSHPLTWLVSGNGVDEGEETLGPLEELSKDSSVWMVYEEVNKSAEDSVKAKLMQRQDLEEDSRSRGLQSYYAWWVGEEGSKIRVTQSESPAAPMNSDWQSTRIPIQSAIQAMAGLEALVPWNADQFKIIRTSQLPLLAPENKRNASNVALAKLFHEVTTHSLSVLSDPVRGGLKEDLSVAMSFEVPRFEKWLARFQGDAPEFYRQGRGLHSYHQWGKRMKWWKGRRVIPAQPYQNDVSPERSSLLAAQAWLDSNQVDKFDEAKIAPEWMGLGIELFLSLENDKFTLKGRPLIRLWNPYHSALSVEGLRFKIGFPNFHAVLQGRRVWKASVLYEVGEEVWYENALYRSKKQSLEFFPIMEEYWEKLPRNWSWLSELKIARSEPFICTYQRDVDESIVEAGAVWDLEFKETSDSGPERTLQKVTHQTRGNVDYGRWRHADGSEILYDEDSEYQVVIEPLRIPWDAYANVDRNRYVRDHHLKESEGESQVKPLMVQEILVTEEGASAWFPVKQVSLPEFTFKEFEEQPLFNGLVFQANEKSKLENAVEAHLGVLGYQVEGCDDVSFFEKRLERRNQVAVNPRFYQTRELPKSVVGFCFSSESQKSLQGSKAVSWSEMVRRTREGRKKVLYEIPSVPCFSLGQWQHYPFAVEESFPYDFAFAHAPDASRVSDWRYRMANEVWDRFYYSGSSLPELEVFPFYQEYRTRKRWKETAIHTVNPLDLSRHTSAKYFLRGGFNVNSTNVEAWKALLRSVEAVPLKLNTEIYGQPKNLATAQVIYPRTTTDSSSSQGILTAEQVESFAKAIVEEIRQRGPFKSVSEFLNRRLDASDMSEHGTLEAAILRSQLLSFGKTPNAVRKDDEPKIFRWAESFDALSMKFIPLKESRGSESRLQAGDLLQSIAPYLTTRSDTFKVRAYGELRERSGQKIVTRVWCEAIVQRLPEWLYHRSEESNQNGDDPWTAPAELRHPDNKKYGRRFEVIHLKWLSPDEV